MEISIHDDVEIIGSESRYHDQALKENPGIRWLFGEIFRNSRESVVWD